MPVTSQHKNAGKKQRKAKKTYTGKKNSARTNAGIKKNIKKAIDQIPELLGTQPLTEHVEKQVSLSQAGMHKINHSEYQSPKYAPATNTKKIILWSGVTLLTAIIFVMWFWNTRSAWYDISSQQSEEQKLLESAKINFEQVMEKSKKIEEDNELQKAVEEKSGDLSATIKNLLKALFVNASTTSSTPNITSSTDTFATNTLNLTSTTESIE